jgi:hypothetical protein
MIFSAVAIESPVRDIDHIVGQCQCASLLLDERVCSWRVRISVEQNPTVSKIEGEKFVVRGFDESYNVKCMRCCIDDRGAGNPRGVNIAAWEF